MRWKKPNFGPLAQTVTAFDKPERSLLTHSYGAEKSQISAF